MKSSVCRTCGSADVAAIGCLPDVNEFAGRVHERPLVGGKLWRCKSCGFVFRHPILHALEYDKLYRIGRTDLWQSKEVRHDFSLIRANLGEVDCGIDVLDIGCYTGELLASLPERFNRYGVEPNQAAARMAATRGIRVIAESVEDLVRLDKQFDVITACDVIEHVANPLAFLVQVRARLNSGGRLLLSTGDCDAWLWRILGARYWYCYFAEHISFIGRRWLQTMPARAGFRVIRTVPFNYRWAEWTSKALLSLVGATAYAFSPRLYRCLYLGIRGASGPGFAPPGCGATKDHIFCELSLV